MSSDPSGMSWFKVWAEMGELDFGKYVHLEVN